MRVRYAARRDLLLRALPPTGARASRAGTSCSSHVPDEAAVVDRAAARGVGVEGLELHRYEPSGPGGLVLGFGALAEPALARAVALLVA